MAYNGLMQNSGGLAAGSNSGTQTSTQNPQHSSQTGSLGPAQNVQTGTANSLLNGQGSIQLPGAHVTTVNMTAAGQLRTAPTVNPNANHGANPVLAGFSVLLFLAAIVLFWTSSRPSVKNTTKKG